MITSCPLAIFRPRGDNAFILNPVIGAQPREQNSIGFSVNTQNKVMQNKCSLQAHRDPFTVRPISKGILFLALFLGVASALQAANVTTAVQQAAGANWNLNTIWSDNTSPTAGNTYQVIAGGNPSRVRNPVLASGQVTTFAGDSLTIDAGQELREPSPPFPVWAAIPV